MRSNYKQLGQYISEVNIKNTNLEVDLGGMRSQLNALHGARQQIDKLLKLAVMPKEEEKK